MRTETADDGRPAHGCGHCLAGCGVNRSKTVAERTHGRPLSRASARLGELQRWVPRYGCCRAPTKCADDKMGEIKPSKFNFTQKRCEKSTVQLRNAAARKTLINGGFQVYVGIDRRAFSIRPDKRPKRAGQPGRSHARPRRRSARAASYPGSPIGSLRRSSACRACPHRANPSA